MTDAPPPVIVGQLSGLPDSASGARHMVWWGNLGFMLIEGMGFLLAAAAYLYLRNLSPQWPPAGRTSPDLLWSGVFTAGLLLSAVPNVWVLKAAQARRTRSVRIGVAVMTLAGALLLAARAVELMHLNVRWSDDAYGSVVWLLMVLHTTHVLTDLGDTAVQALWLHTHAIGDEQFADVEDNSNYWTFVVATWLPIYALVYWSPRLG